MGGPVGFLTGTEQKKPIDATVTSHSLFNTEAGGHASSKPASIDGCVAIYLIWQHRHERMFTWSMTKTGNVGFANSICVITAGILCFSQSQLTFYFLNQLYIFWSVYFIPYLFLIVTITKLRFNDCLRISKGLLLKKKKGIPQHFGKTLSFLLRGRLEE